MGSVVGDVDRGTVQYLYSNGEKVVGNVQGSRNTSNCYTTVSNDINSKYFIKDEAGINSGYPVLKWQVENH